MSICSASHYWTDPRNRPQTVRPARTRQLGPVRTRCGPTGPRKSAAKVPSAGKKTDERRKKNYRHKPKSRTSQNGGCLMRRTTHTEKQHTLVGFFSAGCVSLWLPKALPHSSMMPSLLPPNDGAVLWRRRCSTVAAAAGHTQHNTTHKHTFCWPLMGAFCLF